MTSFGAANLVGRTATIVGLNSAMPMFTPVGCIVLANRAVNKKQL